ncbi:HipA domain-containing protein, partial [Streptococcus gordonii]|nr:HipA domain-containing protein [Streptococcus gordonii]
MPVSNRTYGQQVMNPYLFGLLPDSEDQRKAIAAEFDVRPNNPVALLSHIGLDCPGGVQFCAEEDTDAVLHRAGEYRPIDNHEIALRLKSIRDDRDASWMGLDESWSLGGNQGKFALAFINGRWCECMGSSPTTHIFKNGVIGFKLEALNEFVCMKSAQRAGIATANVEYRMFEDEPALIVERYDRVKVKDGTIRRL